MELIMIPQALLVFYAFLVLGCGSALGFIVARNLRKQISQPDPPLLLERRVGILEDELGDAQSELRRLADENEFLRELRNPRRDSHDLGMAGQRFIA